MALGSLTWPTRVPPPKGVQLKRKPEMGLWEEGRAWFGIW